MPLFGLMGQQAPQRGQQSPYGIPTYNAGGWQGLLSDSLMGLGRGLLSAGPGRYPTTIGQGLGNGLDVVQQLQQQRRGMAQTQFQDQLSQQDAQQKAQIFGLQMDQYKTKSATDARTQKALSDYAATLPPEEQQHFWADPNAYITNSYKGPEKPVTAGGLQFDAKSGTWAKIPGYVEEQSAIAAAGRAPQVTWSDVTDPKTGQVIGQRSSTGQLNYPPNAPGTKQEAGGVLTGDDAKQLGLDPTGTYQKRPDGTYAVLVKPRAEGVYGGNAIDAQDSNIILKGQSDPAYRATPEYAMAWNRQYQQPKLQTTQDPNDPMKQIIQAVIVPPPQGYQGPAAQPGSPAPGAAATAAPIAGTSSQKQLNGEQALSMGFANRMQASESVIGQKGAAGTSMKQSALSDVPIIGNYLISNDRQQLEQAERDFINAQLRRESGAAISSGEFSNARQQYFPQPGDSPETLAQKAANRALVIQGMQQSASPYPLNGSPAASPGDLKKKYGLQ